MSGVTPLASGSERTASPANFIMIPSNSLDPTMLAMCMGVMPLASFRSRMASFWRRSSVMGILPFWAAKCSGDWPEGEEG